MICKKNRGWFFTHCKTRGPLAGHNVFLTPKNAPPQFRWPLGHRVVSSNCEVSKPDVKKIWQLPKHLVVYPPSRGATGKYRFSSGSMYIMSSCWWRLQNGWGYIDLMWMPIQGDGLLWYLTWPYLTWFDTEKTTAVCMLGSWSCGWKKSCKGAGILWIHISRKDSPNV